MATKKISIEHDVYERLVKLRKSLRESFSQVIRRELSRSADLTAGDLLSMVRGHGFPNLGLRDGEISAIEELDDMFAAEQVGNQT